MVWLLEGTRRAFTIGNRGPIRYDEQGNIHPDILEAYWRTGFYVFTGTATQEEIDDVEREFQWFRSRLPTHKGSTVDALGRPAIGIDCKGPTISWAKPLSDPNGGTQNASGRYSWGKMLEPKAEEGAPSEVVVISLGSLQFLESQLRVYGHPGLLKMAEAGEEEKARTSIIISIDKALPQTPHSQRQRLCSVQRGNLDQGTWPWCFDHLASRWCNTLGLSDLGSR